MRYAFRVDEKGDWFKYGKPTFKALSDLRPGWYVYNDKITVGSRGDEDYESFGDDPHDYLSGPYPKFDDVKVSIGYREKEFRNAF